MLNSKADTVPSEKSSPNQVGMHSLGIKRFGKKIFYAIATIIVIAVIAVALLIPQGAATIPLTVEYTVGEKMIYNTTETITFQANATAIPLGNASQIPNTTDINSTLIVEVVDFDGECYTLNHTMMAMLGAPVSMSFIEKVNKTGYSTYFLAEGAHVLASNMSSNPLTGLLERPEVKVGESWQIPLNSGNANINITGSMTLTFGGIQDISVPAGTYKVFKIDTTCGTLIMNYKTPTSNTNMSVSTTISMKGQIYIEYGTGRQIASIMESTVHNEAVGLNYTLSANTTLVQHIKP